MSSRSGAAAALLAAIKQCRDLDTGKRLHCQAAASGNLASIAIANSLVAMYARSGSLIDAQSVFDGIRFKNAASWTAIMHGYAITNGFQDRALEIFHGMDRPDCRACLVAAVACSNLADEEEECYHGSSAATMIKLDSLDKGMSIHSRASDGTRDYLCDMFLASALIDMYSRCGSLLDLRSVFDRMPQHDVVAWTGLIGSYVRSDEPELALELFACMEPVRPNSRTLVAVLTACARIAVKDGGSKLGLGLGLGLATREGVRIHAMAARMGFESDVFVASTLIDVYAKFRRLEQALAVFDGMECPNAVSWNSLLLGSVENGKAELGLEIFDEMTQQGRCLPNDRSFVSALMACSSIAAEDDGTSIGEQIVKIRSLETVMALHVRIQTSKNSISERYVAGTLIDTYSRCGSMPDARRVFDRMPQHDLVAWNALLRGYAENGESEITLGLYDTMEAGGRVPDGRTFLAVLAACGNSAALEAGRRIHDDVRRHRSEGDTFVANALIDFYGRSGSMSEAQLVFDSMESAARNLVSWSALISGYSRQGDRVRVFDLFEQMQQQQIRPDGITLTSVLTACSHAGLAEQGKLLFNSMVSRFGIAPDVGHYNCLIDILGRANRLDEAVEVATTMPFEATGLTWKIILGACHKWSNVRVGRIAFEQLRRSGDGAEASSLVLFSNIVDRSSSSEIGLSGNSSTL